VQGHHRALAGGPSISHYNTIKLVQGHHRALAGGPSISHYNTIKLVQGHHRALAGGVRSLCRQVVAVKLKYHRL